MTTLPDLRLRPFRKTDLEPVLDLWDRAWRAQLDEAYHGFLDRGIFERRLLVNELPDHSVVVAEADGAPVAFLILHLEARHISHLAVDPAAGGRGIGRALADFAVATMDRPVGLSVLGVNTGAQRFWERLGAKPAGETTSPSGRPAILYRLD